MNCVIKRMKCISAKLYWKSVQWSLSEKLKFSLRAQVGQRSLIWIRLIICYIVPWWPSWLSDQIAFSNSESDVVWRVSKLPPWPPFWLLDLNNLAMLDLHVTLMPPIKFWFNLTYRLGEDVVWRISRWLSWPSWNRMILAILHFHNTQYLPSSLSSIRRTVWEQMWSEDFQDAMVAIFDIRMEPF